MKLSLMPVAALMTAISLPAWGADAAMTRMLMPDAKFVAGADLAKVRNSPFGQRLLAELTGKEGDLEKFALLTGFDPRRDLSEIVVGATGEGQGHGGMLAVARGTFEEAKLAAAAGLSGAPIGSFLGVTTVSPKGADAMVAMLGNLFLAGKAADVKAAIERSKNGGGLDPAVAQRVQSVSGRYDAWVVTTGSPAALAGRIANADVAGSVKGDLFQAIESVAAGLRFGPSIEMTGEAVTRSEKDATALADVMKFLVSMAQANAGPQARGMLGTAQFQAEGNTLRFSATVASEEIEKLIGGRARMRAAVHEKSVTVQ